MIRSLTPAIATSIFGAWPPGAPLLIRRETNRSRQLKRTYTRNLLLKIMNDESREYISDSIRTIPDFPKKGIMFHDVTSLLLDPKVCKTFNCSCANNH